MQSRKVLEDMSLLLSRPFLVEGSESLTRGMETSEAGTTLTAYFEKCADGRFDTELRFEPVNGPIPKATIVAKMGDKTRAYGHLGGDNTRVCMKLPERGFYQFHVHPWDSGPSAA